MPSETQRYVVCYDIPDDRRRNKVAKCLDGYGDRVQFSVFEAVLSRVLFDRLEADMRRLMKMDEDQVTLYPLCGACAPKRVRLGLGSADDEKGGGMAIVV